MSKLSYGDSAARKVSGRIADPIATRAALIAVPARARVDGQLCQVTSDRSWWQFASASTAADASGELVQTPSAGSGRWLRCTGFANLVLPFTYATANQAALLTVPAGFKIWIVCANWEITANMTGGTNSAIGVSTSVTGTATQGDILGGATGDIAATLVASGGASIRGTVGDKIATGTQALLLVAADVVRFDRIASAFTAGTGNVHLGVNILTATG